MLLGIEKQQEIRFFLYLLRGKFIHCLLNTKFIKWLEKFSKHVATHIFCYLRCGEHFLEKKTFDDVAVLFDHFAEN